MSDEKKVSPKDVKETQGGAEAKELETKPQSDDDKVRTGEMDPAKPQTTLNKEAELKDNRPAFEQPTGKTVHPDEQFEPARNDPAHGSDSDVLLDPTATGTDRDQSLGFTDRGPTENLADQTQAHKVPDAPHIEPSTYTPSGARPGQQNPVNPQGSPGADPLDPNVGARPGEAQVVAGEGRDGDYTKVITPGEKNPSQRPYEIDHQPTQHNNY